jgi:hypothetical protein
MSRSGKSETQAARERRLRAALRENLKRRKAQARGRSSEQSPAEPQSKPSSEGKEKR